MTRTWTQDPFQRWRVHCPGRPSAEAPLAHLTTNGHVSKPSNQNLPASASVHQPSSPNSWKCDATPDWGDRIEPCLFSPCWLTLQKAFIKTQYHDTGFCVHWAECSVNTGESDFHLMGMEGQSPLHFRQKTIQMDVSRMNGKEQTLHLSICLTRVYLTPTTFLKSCWSRQFTEMPLPLGRPH